MSEWSFLSGLSGQGLEDAMTSVGQVQIGFMLKSRSEIREEKSGTN